jgi:hypothetical protein
VAIMLSLRKLRYLPSLLPHWARRPTYRAGDLIANVAFPLVDVVWLRGQLQHGGEPARLLVAGSQPWANYLPERLLQSGFAIEPVARVRIPSLPRVLQAHREQADLVLVRMDRAWTRFVSDSAYLRVPEWVCAFVDLPDDLEAYLHGNESRRSDVRRLRSKGYTYEISQSEQDLDTFYEHFHAPLVRRRHGTQAAVVPRWLLRHWLSHGGLLWVLYQGRRVAGGLFSFEAGGLHLLSSGCDDQPEARAGFAGIYVFLWLHAHALGIRRLNLGGCRPTTRDGVFRYKRKWGARFAEKPEQYADMHLWWQRPSPALRELLQYTPLVFRDRVGLSQIAALPEKGQSHALASDLRSPGLQRIVLLDRETSGVGPADVTRLDPLCSKSSRELLWALD